MTMSFLDALLKKKESLSTTKTKLIQSDGSVFIETRNLQGFEKIASIDATATSYGFVVDVKPDLQAAEIFPWLFFGSQDVACDENLLRQLSITNVLSVGINVPHFNEIEYDYVEALDVPEFNLLSLFDHCSSIIDHVCEMNGKAYVHCNAGISRSSSVVIAYVMKHSGCSLEQALEVVKRARPCARPNPGFMEQLQTYEKS